MTYLKKKEMLEHLIEMMNKGNCGNAAKLAGRLGVSERTLKNYLSTLREMGYKVIFDQSAKTYLLLKHENL